MIYPLLAHLGARPDGLVQCEYCGKGVIELKCPYQCKNLSFRDASTRSSFCLEYLCNSSCRKDTFGLRSYLSYYYQVQLQMKICQVNYCYFIVWSPNELVILKIIYNNAFIENALGKALTLFMNGVLTELVSRWYSKLMSMRKDADEKENSQSDD